LIHFYKRYLTHIMSEHSSNNSNADMEVIDAADLEDSPPPADDKEVESEEKQIEDATAVDDTRDAIESKVEVAEATASGDTETIGEIEEVSTTTLESVNESAAVNDDDDPPIEILEAPTPPLSQVAPSGPEPAVEIPPKVEASEPVTVPEVSAPSVPAPAVIPDAVPAPDVAPIPVPVEAPTQERVAPSPAPAPQPMSVRPAVTADRPAATLEEVDDDEEDDDDIDETLAERLIGLTEMFPDFVRNGSVSLVKGSWSLAQSCYSLTRAASWVVFSSATILFMPVMIESERLQLQDQQKAQKNQILLGPGAAVSGGPALGPPPI